VNFEVGPTEKPRSLWPFLVIGAAIVVVVVLALGWLGGKSTQLSPAQKPLPFGSAEQSYAPQLKFENLKMSRFANMFDQEVTYIEGDVVNQGNRTIADLQVTVVFRSVQEKVVRREVVRLLGPRPQPIPPGGKQSFRAGFEEIPDTWNMRDPDIRVSGLLFQ
jgi:hypothetical protein